MESMPTISRRSFLAAGAALGTMAAMSGALGASWLREDKALAEEAEALEDEVVVKHMFCQMCGPAKTACSTLCYIKNGRWTNVEGNPDAGNNWGRGSRSLCPKGNSAMAIMYSPTRLQYPMKRVGEKGEGKFERITWDEALDEIAAKLLEQKEQYGAKSYGVLSPQAYSVLMSIGRRFLNVHGSPNYLHSAICNSQRMFSNLVTLGGKNHMGCNKTMPGQIDKTKLLVNWGYNSENSAINQGDPCKRLDAIENGMQTIDIRPMRDGLGTHADIWVPIRPGTDCALAMCILNYLITNDLYDHDFVENWCNGFDEMAEAVADCSSEWASEITGLPVEQIEQIAEMMGTVKPMAINCGNGIGDQQNDGHWAQACIDLIEAITGNIDIAGGAGAAMVMPPALITTKAIDKLSDRMPLSEEDEANGYMAGVSDLVGPETPRWFQTMTTQESGPTSAYNKGIQSILTEDPYPLRFILGQCSNPLTATRQPKTVVEALKKLEYYVVMDTEWNSSCPYADIVLPACVHYELSEQFATKNMAAGTWIGMNQAIQEPLGESMSDWQFYCKLADRMGYGDDFWGGDFDECLREQLDGSGFTLEELREKGSIFVERTDGATPTEPEYKRYAELFAELPNGKVQCYNEWIGNKPNCEENGEISPVPVYNGPAESIAGTPDIAAEYPIVFSDVHAYRLCNHSYYVNVPYLRELQPEPWIKINPATAEQYGIADGDWVKVESPHGWVKMVARYFECIAPDVIMSRRGWWQDCPELGLPAYEYLDGGSEVNVLYDDTIDNYDPFNSAMSKQTLVKISKLDESEIPTGVTYAPEIVE